MEMVILIGIQATGKSEFCRRHFYDTHIRLNLDMLKTRQKEKLLVEACLAARQSFVVDNTNITKAERQKYIRLAKEAGCKVRGCYFRSDVEESLARNARRAESAQVPVFLITSAREKLEPPSLTEGFDEISYVQIGQGGEFIVSEYQDLTAVVK